MEPNLQRKLELRAVSLFIAVIVALMGFSAALPSKPQRQAEAAAESAAPAYQDPSLAGLSVAEDAQPDVDPGKLYY